MNKLLLLTTLAIIGLSVSFAVPVYAEVRTDDIVEVNADEIVDDDLYAIAQHVVIDGTVKGDLIAFAETVTINGVIEGDVLGAARVVKINGQIADDARIAGQTITLGTAASVDDDLVTAGFSLTCESDSRVGGEVKYAGYQAKFAGTVEEDLSATTANCQLDGTFGADVEVTATGGDAHTDYWNSGAPLEYVPQRLTVSESASIAGELKYKSTEEADVDPAATIAGGIDFEVLEVDPTAPPTITERAVAAVKYFFGLLVVGLVVVFGFPKWTNRVTTNIQTKPLASVAWGFGSFVAVFVGVALMLVATIAVAVLLGFVSLDVLLPAWIGAGLLTTASVAVGFAIFAVWISKVFVAYWAGQTLLRSENQSSLRKFFAVALGCGIFVGLSLIPFVGSVFGLLISMTGIGAALVGWLSSRQTATEDLPALPMKQAA